MKYRYETEENSADGFKLVETATGMVIKSKLNIDAVRRLAKHLNNNGGFNGFTPSFFNHQLIIA